MLTIQAVPAFNDNYIWFIQEPVSKNLLIVDPGDAEPVIKAIEQQQLNPMALLITHHHSDHIAGIDKLVNHYNIPVYGPKYEAIPSLTHLLTACHNLIINSAFPPITVLEVPGHTNDHIAFLIDGNLFCGDTLFAAGCGRLLGGTAEQLHASLQLIASLPEQTKIFCAHEYTQANLRFAACVDPSNTEIKQRIADTDALLMNGKPSLPSLLTLELKTNPFLRCQQPDVIQAAQQFCGDQLLDSQAVFTTLRAWKDQF
ncbi:MAG: hydroxyacylglutathione hydrolase [Methylophagaceae bacterium]|jgi:hydroxyacylglutathione hydrolase